MQEIIKNTATAVIIIGALCLPIYTIIASYNMNNSKQKVLSLDNKSVLELPMIVDGATPGQLENVTNMNKEMNGMLRLSILNSPKK